MSNIGIPNPSSMSRRVSERISIAVKDGDKVWWMNVDGDSVSMVFDKE